MWVHLALHNNSLRNKKYKQTRSDWLVLNIHSRTFPHWRRPVCYLKPRDLMWGVRFLMGTTLVTNVPSSYNLQRVFSGKHCTSVLHGVSFFPNPKSAVFPLIDEFWSVPHERRSCFSFFFCYYPFLPLFSFPLLDVF